MAAPYATVLLSRDTWDCCLDAGGNIALASPPYALAQDAASAIRLFQSELWFDTSKGVPYYAEILGHSPSPALIKAQMVRATLTVPGVISAVCYLSSLANRVAQGQVQLSDTENVTQTVGF